MIKINRYGLGSWLALALMAIAFATPTSARKTASTTAAPAAAPAAAATTPAATAASEAAPAATPTDEVGRRPYVNRASMTVTAARTVPYGADADKPWRWTPRVEFYANGPVPAGSIFVFEFMQPDNKPWVTFEVPLENEIKEDGSRLIRGGDALKVEQGSTQTGKIPFKIWIRNELCSLNKVVFEGFATVGRVEVPFGDKKRFDFYVNQDWTLPFAYLYENTRNAEAPYLMATIWFRDKNASGQVDGHIFYKGAEISGERVYDENQREVSMQEKSPWEWALVQFAFTGVNTFNKAPASYPGFNLSEHPGEYELKVLRNGKMARILRFTVGADGKIVDPGLATTGRIGTGRMIFPIEIIGTGDGEWDKNAWKTGAFYGHPIEGFAPPVPSR